MLALEPPSLAQQLARCEARRPCELVGKLIIENQVSARLAVAEACVPVTLPFANEQSGSTYRRKHGRWNGRIVRLTGDPLDRKARPDSPGLVHSYSRYRGRLAEETTCPQGERVFHVSTVRPADAVER